MAKSTHFCGGMEMLSKLSLNASHINCGMEQKVPDCDSNDGKAHLKDSGCCDNEFEILHLEEDFSITKAKLNVDMVFAVALIHTFIFNASLEDSIDSSYSDYPPPFLEQDHQVLYQTFLI